MTLSEMTEEDRATYWAAVKRGEQKVSCAAGQHHGIADGERCDLCTTEMIDMMSVHPDKGPWTVECDDHRVWLQSDDFRHDVILRVDGDFWDMEQKKAYTQLLADKLNM